MEERFSRGFSIQTGAEINVKELWLQHDLGMTIIAHSTSLISLSPKPRARPETQAWQATSWVERRVCSRQPSKPSPASIMDQTSASDIGETCQPMSFMAA